MKENKATYSVNFIDKINFRYTIEKFIKLAEFNLPNNEYFDKIKINENNVELFYKDYFKNIIITDSEMKTYSEKGEKIVKSLALKLYTIGIKSDISNISIFKNHLNGNTDIRMCCNSYLRLDAKANIGVSGKSDEQFEKEERDNLKNNLQNIILEIDEYLPIVDNECLIKIVSIENTVIKYCVLYSYVCELFCTKGNQKKFDIYFKDNFIEPRFNEDMLKVFPNINQNTNRENIFKRDRIKLGNEEEENVFTNIRNLIGHSTTEMLKVNESFVIEQCNEWFPYLLKIAIINDNKRIEMQIKKKK